MFLLVCVCVFFTQNTVDKLIKKTNLALVVGTNSWREQFMEAITVSAGGVQIRSFFIKITENTGNRNIDFQKMSLYLKNKLH